MIQDSPMCGKQISIAAIICAAGSSSRMNGVKKEYLQMPEKPFTVLGSSALAFAGSSRISSIVISVPPEDVEKAKSYLPVQLHSDQRIEFSGGGKNRRASVFNALLHLQKQKPTHVLVHDGARPWLSLQLIDQVIDSVIKFKAAIPALALIETPKETRAKKKSSDGAQVLSIKRHLKRANVYTAQTPQGFEYRPLLAAHKKAAKEEAEKKTEYTDDAEIWGSFAGDVKLIPGGTENMKITYLEDLQAGEKKNMRVGIGKDIHRLKAGRRFLLGGVEIPFEKGEDAHSDGDVLSHAVTDALLGAAGLGDIGELYPPEDPAWKDTDSLLLLKSTWDKVRSEGFMLSNLDCVITCEKPKILPYRELIRQSLAKTLDADPSRIFVKGKTNEGLGEIGSSQAVEAHVVCLIAK